MDYRELIPHPRLAPYVRCYWTLRAPAGHAAAEPAPQRVLPDGCVEMVLNVGAPFNRHTPDGAPEVQPRALLIGPSTRHMSIAPTGEIRLVGIRFAPGGALPFLSVSPREVRDLAPPLEDVSPPFEPFLLERLAAAASGTEAHVLDQALGCELDRSRRLTDRRVRASVRAAFVAERPLRVDALISLTGLGPRQLERRFRETVGYGPKTLCRLARFQRVVRAVEPAASFSLARIAAENGYADQPHLAREFREFAGTTLTGYLRELHPMSDRFHGAVEGGSPHGPEPDDVSEFSKTGSRASR
jgi:AraC-like DNA-binding protein